MMKATFKEWTLTKWDKAFGLEQIEKCTLLERWERMMKIEISEQDKSFLDLAQKPLAWAGKAWNETELKKKIISPLIFCMHEYKRSVDNKENSDAQAFALMVVAREYDPNTKSIYGLYIVGLISNFMALNGNEYCISKNNDPSEEDIFDISRLIKALKVIIQTKLL